MYGVAALVLLHFGGSLGEETEGMLVGPLLMVSAAVGALAGGLPMWMLPAPLLAASGLAMFYDTRSLRDYLLFVAGTLATGEAGVQWWLAFKLKMAFSCGGQNCKHAHAWGHERPCLGNLAAGGFDMLRLLPLPWHPFSLHRRLVPVAALLVPGHLVGWRAAQDDLRAGAGSHAAGCHAARPAVLGCVLRPLPPCRCLQLPQLL